MLRLRRVGKRYGERWAARGISLDVERGQFWVLLGPSGAGKSTILRIIAGVELPDEGTIHFDGADLTFEPPERRPVATVWQSLNLFPHMSVADNVAFGLRARGQSRRVARRRASELLDLVGLSGFEDRPVTSLSGGEQQRVALIRCLAVEPRVVLLDEPLGAIDERLRYDLVHLLRDIHRRDSRTFFMVTHRIEEALACADRLAVIFNGEIHAVDRPEAVYEQPATVQVASLVGRNNVIPVTSARIEGDLCVAETRLGALTCSRWADQSEGEGGFYCIRPHDLTILSPSSPPGPVANALTALVEEVWYEGGETRIYLRASEILLEAERSGSTSSHVPKVGESVRIGWSPEEAFCRIPSSQVAPGPATKPSGQASIN